MNTRSVELAPSLFGRVRRNHALEHATLHVLSERVSNLRLVGRSTFRGFHLYGDISTQEVSAAVQEALRRLQNGEERLAVHPNCGTNLALAGVLAGLGAFVALSGRRRSLADWLGRLPLALTAAMLGVVAAQPIGPLVQARVTTDASPGRLQIVSVTRQQRGPVTIHSVYTRG